MSRGAIINALGPKVGVVSGGANMLVTTGNKISSGYVDNVDQLYKNLYRY